MRCLLFSKLNLLRITPIALNVLLIIWTVAVYPYSKYGDRWAIDPAFAIFPIIIVLHIVLLFIEKWKLNSIIYSITHITISFVIWIYCIMAISKDSL